MILLGAALAAVVLARLAARAAGRRRAALFGGALACLTVAALAAPSGMILRKTLGALAMPMGALWAVTFGGALLAWWRDRWDLAATLGAVALALTVAGSQPLGHLGLAYIEHGRGAEDPFAAPPYDAVVVLGGGTDDRPDGGVQLGASGDRVALAARLYLRGRTAHLVTSGSRIEGLTDHDSARASRRIWRDLGVPDEAIVTVDGARTTAEEARAIAPLVQARGWRRVGLLSSAFHLARAAPAFAARGVELVPIAADVRRRPVRWQGLYSLVPRASGAQDLHTVCWELLGRLVT